LPFCGFQIKAKRPVNPKYCKNPKSIGDFIRNRRLALRLDQHGVANLLKTKANTVYLWENNRAKPTFLYLPKIIEFLGFCPIDPEDTRGRRLAWARESNGLSQSSMAIAIGIDPGTLGLLEKSEWRGRAGFVSLALDFLASTTDRREAQLNE
jgi:transcriptional regulator with XRE-family HTH domain